MLLHPKESFVFADVQSHWKIGSKCSCSSMLPVLHYITVHAALQYLPLLTMWLTRLGFHDALHLCLDLCRSTKMLS